jgi:hypothetical protein
VHQIRKRLTYANVMSSIAVFLVLGGATAFAASHLGKNSVGTKQLKANAVTTDKIKKNAVTTKKLADGAITGAKVNLSSLGTVPSAANSATTNVIKTSKGVIFGPQEAAAFQYGPITIMVKCFNIAGGNLTAQAFISSATDGTVFDSWRDGSSKLGPATPEAERELNAENWADSSGVFAYDSASDIGVSATAANGQSFTGFLALASEKDTNTCWWWWNGTIIG